MSAVMTDTLPRFAPQGIKLGKRSREYCPISMEHTPGCWNLSDMTHVPSAPSPRLGPKSGLSRNCFKSLADLSAADHTSEKQKMNAILLMDQKKIVPGNSWGWFVNEDY